MDVRFGALEHRADGGFSRTALRLVGDSAGGWQLERNGEAWQAFGPGFELLRTRACGVCATDLARRFLPFPLPQVTGHEVLAEDDAGRRRVVEINASCAARHLPPCPTCARGLDRHCPDRRVLGIHDLPGGFGPVLLAPVGASLEVPSVLPDETALLVEPFAAALHGVRSLALQAGDRVVVLGPRRLGMLVIAALAAERRRRGADWEIVAAARRRALRSLALELGADRFEEVGTSRLPDDAAEVVIDTTGAPEGFLDALRMARREVHLKSTCGQPAGGLAHATELVVDELRVAPLSGEASEEPVPWLAAAAPPPGRRVVRGNAADLAEASPSGFGTVVVDTPAAADAAVRPWADRQRSLLRPGGTLQVHPTAAGSGSPLLSAVVERGLVVSTSRCGDFRAALECLSGDPSLLGLGPRLMTHRFGPDALAEAFEAAASPDSLKVSVVHPGP